ncbi:hypothetical protein IL334_005627 [Kwoniella shivajii]|uniref:Uncharacterized protein n=1 Tax=Kwoniella shivajii TaxID=564305 RepID=A0ABZ1D3N6_9TREE|nr:hypothetical protein IL334_005627 [Kwoniella shivajii]
MVLNGKQELQQWALSLYDGLV